ncbi:hypothetical protein [Candidatus Njordibacter sp. Uisw_002]|uniref:hypothetical protein n=1 Tax=Candidatus Njordibacter sp. Uisw_002 TaxID=3230971 RepID=UPI003D38EC7E
MPKKPTVSKSNTPKNALTHGLTSQSITSSTDQKIYQQMYDELTSEYAPQTITERILIERVAVQYVRWQRAIREESNEIEVASLTEVEELSLRTALNLTQEQAEHYATARFRGEFHNDEHIEENSILIQRLSQESFRLLERGEHTTIPDDLEEYPMLFVLFDQLTFKHRCSKAELLDGRYELDSLVSAFIRQCNRTLESQDLYQSSSIDKKLSHSDFLNKLREEALKQFISIDLHPKAEKLFKLAEQVSISRSTNIDKITRYMTTIDRQFSKALGELRVVIEDRRRREALMPKG